MTSLGERAHGGRVFEAARALGRPWQDIIDFSANINPLGQPLGLKEALFNDFERSLHYPEVRAESLSLRLAEMTGLAEDHFMAGAGSTPHLHLLPRALGLSRPVVIGPAFAEYEGALARAGLATQYILTREEDDWLLTRETLERALRADPDAIFLATPANPTGRLAPGEILEELAAECRLRDIWLVLDEAFIDFTEPPIGPSARNGASENRPSQTCFSELQCPQWGLPPKGSPPEMGRPALCSHTLLPLVENNTRLIVLRSLTKIFALPGLRLAFLAAHPRVIGRLTPLMEPWPLSSQAITAGHFCLSRSGFKESSLAAVKDFRQRQRRALEALNMGRLFPSECNFMLLKLRPELESRALVDHLFGQGLLVRDAANFVGLRPGFIRLAVRPPAEVEALVESLGVFLSQ